MDIQTPIDHCEQQIITGGANPDPSYLTDQLKTQKQQTPNSKTGEDESNPFSENSKQNSKTSS